MQDHEIKTRIQEILAEIQPMVIGHGGRIEFLEYHNGIVRVQLHGACVTCPMSLFTIKLGLEERLKEKLPFINSVEAQE